MLKIIKNLEAYSIEWDIIAYNKLRSWNVFIVIQFPIIVNK